MHGQQQGKNVNIGQMQKGRKRFPAFTVILILFTLEILLASSP